MGEGGGVGEGRRRWDGVGKGGEKSYNAFWSAGFHKWFVGKDDADGLTKWIAHVTFWKCNLM